MSNLVSFLGNVAKDVAKNVYAGQSANEWTKRAVDWAVKGGHDSNVRNCCWNAAKAIVGPNGDSSVVKSVAETIIKNLTR